MRIACLALTWLFCAVHLVPQSLCIGQAGSADLIRADLQRAVDAGEIPGAVLLVGKGTGERRTQAVGRAGIEPDFGLVAEDTIYDLASLTKVVATATSVMKLVDLGKVQLTAPVAEYLTEFGQSGKGGITVEHLLLHQGGLIPDNALKDYLDGPKLAWDRICALEPRAAPGATFTYTDVGFIVLGKLVERVDGRPLNRFAKEEIFQPLGMVDTSFGVPEGKRSRCAPTEKRGGEWMLGTVHDPRAYRLDGVAGHAGLFSTAADLSRWCRMILGGGVLAVEGAAMPTRVLSASAVQEMTRTRWLPDRTAARALGFDVATGYSSPRGSLFPRGASFGHTGFTGTCLWMDPGSKGYYVLLTNRVHPSGKGKVTALRRRVADKVAAELGMAELAELAPVLAGVDVMERDDCVQIKGRRVGLITNVTGRARSGRRTIDILNDSPNADLVRIFSPEHGLFGKLEGKVGDATDVETGLPVFSLYGETRKPTAEMLDGLDAVVFDIQDIGVRYYTYVSTLGLAMEACAEAGLTVIVLDRPNPITGTRVEGPRIDEDRLSFIGWRPLPVTHGMTVGELAGMFRKEWAAIPCALEVVRLEGWERRMWWEETGLTWIDPSPNMRNPTQTVLYPCVGLLEGTNLSVGRGTDEPFERFGAPWVDGARLAAALRALALPGLAFTAIEFTPDASKFSGERCEGVHLTVTNREAMRPVEAGLAIVWILNRMHSRDLDLGKTDTRLISRATWEQLVASKDWREVPGSWGDDVTSFRRQRAPYLLY